MDSFYSKMELESLGLKSYGTNVLISRKCSIYGAENISVGSHVRIDDFCILSGCIMIGNYVHIAAYANLIAGACGIYMDDYTGVSSRVSIYAKTDDYSGSALTNSTIPEKYRNVYEATVRMEKYAQAGASSVILPGVVMGEGCACGAMTLVNKSLEPWGIYAGIPAKRIKERKKDIMMKNALLIKSVN